MTAKNFGMLLVALLLGGCGGGGGSGSSCPSGTCNLRLFNGGDTPWRCGSAIYQCGRVDEYCLDAPLRPRTGVNLDVPAGVADITITSDLGDEAVHFDVVLPAGGDAHINIGTDP
jgi:hypothetical protein